MTSRLEPKLSLVQVDPRQRPRLFLAFAVLASCSLLGTGCNTMSQASAPTAQASAPSAQGISIQTTLPNASIGSSYHEVLSVSGGLAPYRFAISQGELPPGLVLSSSTGSISGAPAQAGNFTFTILVTGATSSTPGMPEGNLAKNFAASGSRAYTLAISSCVTCVAVQVSPANPSVAASGKLQFTAAVTNTSNTGVIWSASAGSISSNGLFTAPANISTKSITVTASSVANSAAQASTGVTVTSSTLTITTTSLPFAVVGTSYSASLTASGGQPPYQWSIGSGSLPAGLTLNASTGILSGSTTQTGTSTFSVKGTDAASHSAQQSLSVVSNSAGTCGPPTYGCSRTDQDIVQIPSPLPNVGNLSGANTIITDPDFGNRIVRITDANSNPLTGFQNRTYTTEASGSADENPWNIDSTLLVVQDSGTNSFPYTFNPSTLQAARMYVPSFPTTNGLMIPYAGDWSRVNANFLYTYGGTTISKYDFTDRTNPPAPQTFYDYTSSPSCLPAGFTETWKTKGGISADDTTFGMAYSNTGGQGTGIYAVVYKVGSGCSMLNTQTGQVTSDWGAKGSINIGDRWTIHNVKLSKDGNWLVISSQACTSPSCLGQPYFWQIGTTNVIACGAGWCGGHWTEGYTHWVNNNNTPYSNQMMRLFAESDSFTALTHSFPTGLAAFDQHQSWNNVDPADSLPFASTTWIQLTPFTGPWYNEIIAVAADGSGTTWRFAHSFITARSQNFSTEYGIGSVSQDGRFFVFSSDWMGQLGSESGPSTCTIGTDCRGDVFVVEMR
jgi:Putative Ig domain